MNGLLLDYTEGRLLNYIKNKDLKAIMFLLQTKGKHRGYSKYWKNKEKKALMEFVFKLFREKDVQFVEAMRRSLEDDSPSERLPEGGLTTPEQCRQ